MLANIGNSGSIPVDVCKDLLKKQSSYFCKQLELVRGDIMNTMDEEFTDILNQIAEAHIRVNDVYEQTEKALNKAEENRKLLHEMKKKIISLESRLEESEKLPASTKTTLISLC